MRRALFGGSFDPFHNGHLAVVRELDARGLCDRVTILPAALSPGKHPPRVAGEHRVIMAVLGTSGLDLASVLDLELHRPGPSYTVDTLAELIRMYPGDAWSLVVGADSWRDFRSWRDPDRLLELARVIVYPRAGFELDPSTLPPRATLLEDFRVTVSSTDIRRRLAAGEAVDELLSGRVLAHIRRHGLYADDGG